MPQPQLSQPATQYAVPERFLALLSESSLTDLLLNGARDTWADFGQGLRRVANPFESEAELEQISRQLLELADRHIDFANPIADCVLTSAQVGLAGGATFRFHAVLAGATSRVTLLSVRKHSAKAIGLHEFAGGRLELEIWLRGVIERRENFLISGATGSGKTTLLRAMLSAEVGQRIIAIEETSELAPIQGHFVSLQTRQPNTEGRGGIDLDTLLSEALRMRPDRLVVGEVRGRELLTLVNALNTGHRGAAGSIHANNSRAVANRIATIGLQAGWAPIATAAAVAEAVDWVIHVERRGHTRVITDVASVGLARRGELLVTPVPEVSRLM